MNEVRALRGNDPNMLHGSGGSMGIAATVVSRYEPNGAIRGPAFLAAVVIPLGLLLAFALGLRIVPIMKRVPEQLSTFEVRQSAPPAAEPAPQPEAKPDAPKPVSEIIAPPPKVEVPATPSPVQVSNAPLPRLPDPAPAAAAQSAPAPAAPPGPVSVGNLATKLISGAPPRYPIDSRRKREEGVVVLRLVVAEDGTVQSAALQTSSGFDSLDQAALDAVRKWRWSPTLRNGVAVPVTGLVRIPFSLKKS